MQDNNKYYRFIVKGIVQAVGFRPYIYRKAKSLGLKGHVKNIGYGVEILVNDMNFIQKLDDLPPLSKITEFNYEKCNYEKINYDDFKILKSSTSQGETILPPDIFMCKDCLEELRDKNNKRKGYYFITCTNCGPRFSMITDFPYDRPNTAMDEFKMCSDCYQEYTNPLDRRYHAQTIACKNCGPKLKLYHNTKNITPSNDEDTIEKTANLILKNQIISIKGVGGFHLCSLTKHDVVNNVRKLLRREKKPFAILVKDLNMLKNIAHFNDKEKKLLLSPQRPIVVLAKKNKDELKEVSELDSIGVMLPYTTLHHMLFDYINKPLLMTSCNLPGDPVNVDENIGNYFLTHERKIINRCDDSVIKVINNVSFFLRRSRGYVPLPVNLPIKCQDTISVGAEMSNTISCVKKNSCYVSQHIGQSSKFETFEFQKKVIDTFMHLTRLKPKIVVSDFHPTYNSSLYAHELSQKYKLKHINIQHHKAHAASVAAEHNLNNYTAIIMDGLGYGDDKKIWGGEVFDVFDDINFERIGHLESQPQLGGDSATIYPKKMLFGILTKILTEKEIMKLNLFDKKQTNLYLEQLEQNFNIPYTTSAGRILDAVAALLGICDKRYYDGRPAMLLESIATHPLKFDPIIKNNILETTPLIKFILENINHDKGKLAATAQYYLAKGLFEIAKKTNKQIVFSGGVAYNKMITSFMIDRGVLVNKEIPSGDGGICYGQAYLANLIFKNK